MFGFVRNNFIYKEIFSGIVGNMANCKRAGALILNPNMNKCLMVFQKSSRMWGVPKGQKEDNEDSFVCMVREVKEEVGLNLNDIKFEILGSTMVHTESYIYILKLFLDPLPICSPPLEDGNENHEIERIEWVDLKDAYERKNNSITRNALFKLKKYLSSKNKNNDPYSLFDTYNETYNFILSESAIY